MDLTDGRQLLFTIGNFDAVNLLNYDKLPCNGKVVEIRGQKFVIEWWKKGKRKKCEKWQEYENEVLPVTCILLFAFKFNNHGMLSSDTSKNLKNAYKKVKC